MALPLRRDSRPEQSAPLHSPKPVIGAAPWLPNAALAVLRVVTALMFMQHGLQKHFGLLLTPEMMPFHGPPALFSQMWFAGTLELAGGAILVLGLMTRIVAFLLCGEMAVAYFTVHAPQAFW